MNKLSLILVFLISFNLYGNDSLFVSANSDYANQEYNTAIKKYNLILSSNLESHELYYNLANSFFKINEIHQAIYYYEKALKIKPDFDDAKENLEICNLQLIDKIEEIPELMITSLYNNIINFLSLKNWIYLTLIFIWVSLIIFSYNSFVKKNKKSVFYLVIFSFFLFFITTKKYNQNINVKEAIIYSSVINVMSAPSEQSTNLFSLHIGTKVKIEDQIENWVNIRIANGKKGWVLIDNLKEI
jgi:tetratricopeptide (TPR) repeat protein